jgi:hypothetical protein
MNLTHKLFPPPPRRPYFLPEAGRQRLRCAIARTQPWLKSTGPKTLMGKIMSRQNALKHGLRSKEFTDERRERNTVLRTVRKQQRDPQCTPPMLG